MKVYALLDTTGRLVALSMTREGALRIRQHLELPKRFGIFEWDVEAGDGACTTFFGKRVVG
jgi:hypothetical protein